ncbi:MAG: helix-turn-helix domain-containing protein [Acidimicrobiia bacterium]|nr:helix-turn-helix domain-containing protein [Acidimicrobiia bacterium]
MSDKDFVQSLERGLAVMRSFSPDRPRQTLSDVARTTGLTRATARRLLLTLSQLGYVRTDEKFFELTPRVLDIAHSYIASLNLTEIAQPYMERFCEEVHEASSIAVLDDTEIVYVARVPAKRIMTVAIGLGSRFPAYQTSLGRVLLAELDNDDIVDIYDRSDHSLATDRTVTSSTALLAELKAVRDQGWALVDQELEIGVRSLSAPIRNVDGAAVASMNVSTHAGRTDLDEVLDHFLPRLLDTVGDITAALALR